MDRFEVVKEWVVRTKEEVKEQERVKEMIGNFIEVFEFLPDELQWVNNAGKRILKATAQWEMSEKLSILGERVEKVEFGVEEDYMEETEWKMSEFTRGQYTVYKWRRYFPGFSAWVEILVK